MSAKKWLCKICADGCYLAGTDRQISFCRSYKPQTNADRIRAMSDEELAAIFDKGCPPDRLPKECVQYWKVSCKGRWADWLKQPVKDGEGE